jgi:hypothetical protein
MKYFVELLESYSKLKKRKLILLSEASDSKKHGQAKGTTWKPISDEAKNRANFWIGQAIQAGNQKVPVTDVGGEIWVAKGGDTSGAIFYNGFQGGFQKKICSKGETGNCKGSLYSDFAKKFEVKKEGTKEPSAEQANQEVQPGGIPAAQPLPPPQIQIMTGPGSRIAAFFNQSIVEPKPDPMANDQLFQMGQEASQNMVEAAQLSIGAFKYFGSLSGAASKFIKSEGAARSVNYLFGGQGQSLESKITKVSYKMVSVRDGLYDVKEGGKIAPEDLLAYSEVMKEFFGIFKPDGPDIKQKINNKAQFLKNRFTLNSDDTVTIYLDDAKTKSLVFKETEITGSSGKGLLRFMLEGLEKQLEDKKLTKANILKKASAGFNNAVRGVLLEKITIYNTLLQRASAAQTPEERSKWENLVKKHLGSDKKFKENLRKLKELNEDWTMAGEVAALPEQDHYFNAALTQFFGEDVSLLFKSAHVIASDVQRKKPFTMLHVGTETGPGLKADAIEVYLQNPPEGASLEIASEVPQLQDYIAEGLVAPDQQVYLRRPDYKHYLDYGDNTQFNAGGSSRNSIFDLIKGIPQVAGSSQYRRGIKIGGSQDRTRLIAYNNQNLIGKQNGLSELQSFVGDIEKSIEKLLKVSPKNIDPKDLKTKDRVTQIAQAFADTLKKTFTHKDQNKTNLIANVNRYAKEYLEAKKDKQDEKFEKFMGGLQAAMTSLHINKALNNADRTVGKNMLLSIVNSAAGSVQKGACSINRVMGTNSSRQYEFERSAPLNAIQEAIKSGGPDQIEFDGSDFNVKDTDGTVLGSISFDPSKDKYVLYYDEKFIQNKLGVKPTIVQYKTSKDQGMETPQESTLLNVFIQNQMKLLETLMVLQKKSVVK